MSKAPRRLPSRTNILLETLLVHSSRPRSEEHPLDIDRVLSRVVRSLPDLAADVRKPPGTLLAEILRLSTQDRKRALATRAVLRRPEFFDYVRQTALSALPRKPEFAETLAFLSVEQAEVSSDLEESRRHLLAAYCLLASIRRLRSLPKEADLLLDQAGLLVAPQDARARGQDARAEDGPAVYLRTLALRRWEQGQPDVSHALLAHAAHVTRTPTEERTHCRLLLGLLHAIEGVDVAGALGLFRSASNALDAAHAPLPALLARLGLALKLAQAGDVDGASEQRVRAQELFPLLAEDPWTLAYPTWLDARVAAVTQPDLALARLEVARDELLAQQMPFAATLATVDGVLLLARSDRAASIPEFLKQMPLPLRLPPATQVCANLAALPEPHLQRAQALRSLRHEISRLPTLLRRVCLLRGISLEPLPFI